MSRKWDGTGYRYNLVVLMPDIRRVAPGVLVEPIRLQATHIQNVVDWKKKGAKPGVKSIYSGKCNDPALNVVDSH